MTGRLLRTSYHGHPIPVIAGLQVSAPSGHSPAVLAFFAPGEERPRWRIAPVCRDRDGAIVLALWTRNRLATRMHVVQGFRWFGPDDLPSAFDHIATKEAARRRDERLRASMVEIACVGCGRTQRLAAAKVIPADGYTCGYGACTRNADFHLPRTPEGCVCVLELHAAGGFSGWTIRPATVEEREATLRARAIRAAGMAQLGRSEE